jgi:hypothetical protein
MSLAVSPASWSELPYLDDSNKTAPAADPSLIRFDHHKFPRVHQLELESGASAQAYSKYTFIDLHGVGFGTAETVQGYSPDTLFLRHISGREYQGYTQSDACFVTAGVAFNGTGPASQGGPKSAGCNIYAGHWLYKAGSPLTQPITASSLVLPVEDASRFETGQYVVIYDAPAGSFAKAEHALVSSRNLTANTITLQSRGYKSTAYAHAAGAIVAQHVLGQGTDNLLWAFNFSSKSPKDANGRTWGDFYATWLANNYAKYKGGITTTANVAGIVLDTDFYFELKPKATDANNDLVTDNGLSGTGANWLGEGLDQFYNWVATRAPHIYLLSGVHDGRGYESAEGAQGESWVDYGNGDFTPNPKYLQLNSMFAMYLYHMGARTRGPALVHNLTKTPTKLYPGAANPAPPDNRPFRLGLALTLMEDGYFGTHSRDTADAWWDEYAVDVATGSPNFGKAVPKTDYARIYQHRGWLGRPTGKFRRVYSDASFAANLSLIPNGTFDSGIANWTPRNVGLAASSDRMDGTGALAISTMNPYKPNIYDADVRSETVNLVAGKGYTIAFSARADEHRDIVVALGSESNVRIPVGPTWRRYVIGFEQATTQTSRLQFQVGRENSAVWLDSVYLFEGNANVFRRDFERGIVIANATPEARTVSLGGTFQRISGTQDPTINNGQSVTSVTLAPYDGILLIRPSQSPPPPPPPPPPPEPHNICGSPVYDRKVDSAIFLWKECSTGQWKMVMTAGPAGSFKASSGRVASTESLGFVSRISIEKNDVLDTSRATEIAYSLRVDGPWFDGFNFTPVSDGSVCFGVGAPAGTKVLVGPNRLPISTPFSLLTLGPCG